MYAERFVAFQKALDTYTAACKALYQSGNVTEEQRETMRLAQVKLLQLYNAELTAVQHYERH